LIEVKLDSDFAPQQRALFDSFKAKEKRLIRGMDDYMSL